MILFILTGMVEQQLLLQQNENVSPLSRAD